MILKITAYHFSIEFVDGLIDNGYTTTTTTINFR